MKKTGKVDYINKKIKALPTSEFFNFIGESPLRDEEKAFLKDIYSGLSYDDLSKKYQISTSRVAKKKRAIYEKLYDYECNYVSFVDVQQNNINLNKLINTKIQAAFEAKDAEIKEKEALLDSYINKKEKEIINKKLQQIKNSQEHNSRGTKKSRPIEIKDENIKEEIKILSSAELKRKYVALYASGKISGKEASNILGVTVQYLSTLKKKYLIEKENCSFENQNIGRIPVNKTPEETINKIIELYKNEYKEFPISEFTKIINEKYSINKSQSFIRTVLANSGLKSPTADKYNGKTKDLLGNDFLLIMEKFRNAIEKKELSELEEYGLIHICEFAFSKAYLSLNSISKIKYKLSYRTSYSLFNEFVEKGYLDIENYWKYWNRNHDKFSYVYNKPTKYKVIQDIKQIYYPMFQEIELYVSNYKNSQRLN